MLPQKQNYLSVTYEFSKGLHFKWNFKDIFQYTTFYHHLFVIRGHDLEFLAPFLTAYYRKMKSGDLVAALYWDSAHNKVRLMKWVEKTQITTFDFFSLIKRLSSQSLSQEAKAQLMGKAAELTKGDSQHYVVNVMMETGPLTNEEEMRRVIQEYRLDGGFTHICSFLGHFKWSSFSFTSGINFIAVDLDEINSLLQFYSVHINSASIKKAKITLECLNGQLLSYNDSIWKNVDFNKIQKNFYGPSVHYTQDEIHFHLQEQAIGHHFELVLGLELMLFSGQLLKNTKKISLCVPSRKYLDKSINMALYDSQVNLQGVWVTSNPYSSFTIVKLIQITNSS